MTEHQLQASIIAEADLRANQDPRWRFLMAIPNGQFRKGQRMEPGLRAGVPDLFLPIASRGYHGLWIELKVGKNRESIEQMEWKINLTENGYCSMTVRDYADRAIELILWYLGDEE